MQYIPVTLTDGTFIGTQDDAVNFLKQFTGQSDTDFDAFCTFLNLETRKEIEDLEDSLDDALTEISNLENEKDRREQQYDELFEAYIALKNQLARPKTD